MDRLIHISDSDNFYVIIWIVSCIVSFILGWILHGKIFVLGMAALLTKADGKLDITCDDDGVYFNGEKVSD